MTGLETTAGPGPIGGVTTVGSGRFLVWCADDPLPPDRAAGAWFGLVLVQHGTAVLQGRDGRLEVGAGDVVLLDGAWPAALTAAPGTRKLVLELPRQHVAARHTDRLARAATKLARGRPGHGVLSDFLLSVQRLVARGATGSEGASVVAAAVELIGALPGPPATAPGSADAVVARALDAIRAQAADPSFNAVVLADQLGLSRRRLDELFQARARTASKEIWRHRLCAAATLLADPRGRDRKIIDVALSAGFKDAAHFSRAFARHFGRPPQDWRRQPSAADGGPAALGDVHLPGRR